MKKILFAVYSLDIGGIEVALINLVNKLINENKYDITIVLEKKEGALLNKLDSRINVIEYNPCCNKNILIRKTINFIRQFKFKVKYKNKFDYAISYATYSLACSFVARCCSKKRALWIHNNYLSIFENNIKRYKKFFYNLHFNKFKKLIFVSEESKGDFDNIFCEYTNKSIVCNNIVSLNAEDTDILEADKNLFKKYKDDFIFVNIGRHDEKQKKLTRLIEAAEKLKNDDLKFKIFMIGKGPDTITYKELVKKLNLDNYVIFLGPKKNPYFYYENCNAVIMTSDYEGYPVVFLESMFFGKPIITTDVSDSKKDIENKYGFVCKKDVNDIYLKMCEMIKNGYEVKFKLDVDEYNRNILEKFEDILKNL